MFALWEGLEQRGTGAFMTSASKSGASWVADLFFSCEDDLFFSCEDDLFFSCEETSSCSSRSFYNRKRTTSEIYNSFQLIEVEAADAKSFEAWFISKDEEGGTLSWLKSRDCGWFQGMRFCIEPSPWSHPQSLHLIQSPLLLASPHMSLRRSR